MKMAVLGAELQEERSLTSFASGFQAAFGIAKELRPDFFDERQALERTAKEKSAKTKRV